MRSLWSTAIKPTALSPFAIIAPQAEAITKQTNGVIVGHYNRHEDEQTVRHMLTVEVPALAHYKRMILSAKHSKERIYPVTVDADCFRESPFVQVSRSFVDFGERGGGSHTANGPNKASQATTDEELIAIVEKVLTSDEVVSLIQFLVASANEAVVAQEATNSSPEN